MRIQRVYKKAYKPVAIGGINICIMSPCRSGTNLESSIYRIISDLSHADHCGKVGDASMQLVNTILLLRLKMTSRNSWNP